MTSQTSLASNCSAKSCHLPHLPGRKKDAVALGEGSRLHEQAGARASPEKRDAGLL